MALTPEDQNAERNEVSEVIGETKFVLVPSFQNISSIETNIGRNFVKIVAEFRAEKPSFSFTEIATIIFIAQKNEPKMSYQKIGSLLAAKGGMFKGMNLVTKFIANALIDGDDSKNE